MPDGTKSFALPYRLRSQKLPPCQARAPGKARRSSSGKDWEAKWLAKRERSAGSAGRSQRSIPHRTKGSISVKASLSREGPGAEAGKTVSYPA